MQESQDIQKYNILHQLLSLPDNVGDLLANIKSAVMPVTWNAYVMDM
jgi:hypothetical protein